MESKSEKQLQQQIEQQQEKRRQKQQQTQEHRRQLRTQYFENLKQRKKSAVQKEQQHEGGEEQSRQQQGYLEKCVQDALNAPFAAQSYDDFIGTFSTLSPVSRSTLPYFVMAIYYFSCFLPTQQPELPC